MNNRNKIKKLKSCFTPDNIYIYLSSIKIKNDSIYSASNNQGRFRDLKKAFDTIDYQIQIGKLEDIDIGGTSLELLASYLTARRQGTLITVTTLVLGVGVPLGTLLGTLLFRIYVK